MTLHPHQRKTPINAIFRLIILAAIVSVVTSCASQERYFRSERSAYVSRAITVKRLSSKLDGLVQIHCVNMHGGITSVTNSSQPCLYYSVDISGVLADPDLGLDPVVYGNNAEFQKALIDRRNTLARLLLKISDDNCQTFLNRAAYHKLGGDTFVGVFRDLLAAGSGVAAQVHPLSATSLAAGNLVVGAYDKTQGAIYVRSRAEAVARFVGHDNSP